MKAGSGEIVVGGESKLLNPFREGLSLEILCDLDDRPVCTARSGGAMLTSTGIYDSVKRSIRTPFQTSSLCAVNPVFINLVRRNGLWVQLG